MAGQAASRGTEHAAATLDASGASLLLKPVALAARASSPSALVAHLPSTFHIGNAAVGAGHPCFLIAEIGQAHDGSLGTAHAYVDAVARTGASAVKFQTHIAAAESTPA